MSAAVASAVRPLRRIAGGHARAHHWDFARDGRWTSRTPKGRRRPRSTLAWLRSMPASDWLPAFDALSRMGTIGQNRSFVTVAQYSVTVARNCYFA